MSGYPPFTMSHQYYPLAMDESMNMDVQVQKNETFQLPEKYTKKVRGKLPAKPFPLKLMEILAHKEYENIITWLPDGKSFKILKPKEFTAVILPKHLKEAKYSTFKRKMSCWGFQREQEKIQGGSAKCYGLITTFYHPYFQRNRADLLDKVSFSKNGPPAKLDDNSMTDNHEAIKMKDTRSTSSPEATKVEDTRTSEKPIKQKNISTMRITPVKSENSSRNNFVDTSSMLSAASHSIASTATPVATHSTMKTPSRLQQQFDHTFLDSTSMPSTSSYSIAPAVTPSSAHKQRLDPTFVDGALMISTSINSTASTVTPASTSHTMKTPSRLQQQLLDQHTPIGSTGKPCTTYTAGNDHHQSLSSTLKSPYFPMLSNSKKPSSSLRDYLYTVDSLIFSKSTPKQHTASNEKNASNEKIHHSKKAMTLPGTPAKSSASSAGRTLIATSNDRYPIITEWPMHRNSSTPARTSSAISSGTPSSVSTPARTAISTYSSTSSSQSRHPVPDTPVDQPATPASFANEQPRTPFTPASIYKPKKFGSGGGGIHQPLSCMQSPSFSPFLSLLQSPRLPLRKRFTPQPKSPAAYKGSALLSEEDVVKALSTRKSGANTNLSFPLSSEKEQRNFASPRRLLFGSSSRTAEHPNLPSPQRLFESSSNTNVANNKSQNEMLPFSTSIEPTPLPLPPPTTKNTSRRSPSPFPFPAENQNVQRPPCSILNEPLQSQEKNHNGHRRSTSTSNTVDTSSFPFSPDKQNNTANSQTLFELSDSIQQKFIRPVSAAATRRGKRKRRRSTKSRSKKSRHQKLHQHNVPRTPDRRRIFEDDATTNAATLPPATPDKYKSNSECSPDESPSSSYLLPDFSPSSVVSSSEALSPASRHSKTDSSLSGSILKTSSENSVTSKNQDDEHDSPLLPAKLSSKNILPFPALSPSPRRPPRKRLSPPRSPTTGSPSPAEKKPSESTRAPILAPKSPGLALLSQTAVPSPNNANSNSPLNISSSPWMKGLTGDDAGQLENDGKSTAFRKIVKCASSHKKENKSGKKRGLTLMDEFAEEATAAAVKAAKAKATKKSSSASLSMFSPYNFSSTSPSALLTFSPESLADSNSINTQNQLLILLSPGKGGPPKKIKPKFDSANIHHGYDSTNQTQHTPQVLEAQAEEAQNEIDRIRKERDYFKNEIERIRKERDVYKRRYKDELVRSSSSRPQLEQKVRGKHRKDTVTSCALFK